MGLPKIPGSCRQFAATLIANLLSIHMGIIFGWSLTLNPMAVILLTAIELSFEPELDMLETRERIIVLRVIALLSTLAVLPMIAFISERFGRRAGLAMSTIPFITFCILIATAQKTIWLFVAMMFGVVACAMQLYAVPIYISEISSSNRRGTLGVIQMLLLGIGVCLGYLKANIWLTPLYALLSLILPVVFLIGLALLPETPVWLARKGKIPELRRAQDWLRKDEPLHSELLEAEGLNDGLGNIVEMDSQPVPFKDMFKFAEVRKGFGISVGLLLGQALLQINGILSWFYLTILLSRGIHDRNLLLLTTIAIYGAIYLILALLIDIVGRRPLLIISCIGMTVAFVVCGSLLNQEPRTPLIAPDILLGSMIGLFCISYILGMGSMPFLMAIEVIPNNVVSYVYAISMGIFWIVTWIITFFLGSWQFFTEKSSLVHWYLSYAGLCILLLFFVFIFVPETKKKYCKNQPVVQRPCAALNEFPRNGKLDDTSDFVNARNIGGDED